MGDCIKPRIVISAVNLHEAGPLTILKDCLRELSDHFTVNYDIIALVGNVSILGEEKYNIKFIEHINVRSSWINRIWFEYFTCKKISKKLNPYLWFSLHDITPNVITQRRAVYCHNPSPLYKASLNEVSLDFKFYLFTILYKYLYQINIKKNDFVVVQQETMRTYFQKGFGLKNIVVAYPKILAPNVPLKAINSSERFIFFFPSQARVFKNFEVILQAVEILNNKRNDFEVRLTIDGNENQYSKYLFRKYSKLKNVSWEGRKTRDEVFNIYQSCNAVIFPSKLETWGLPITEAKFFKKQLIVADLPYAHETVGEYDRAIFFNPDNAYELCKKMSDLIDNKVENQPHLYTKPFMPFCENWNELFNILLS
ncbi:glycosyltransferase [Parasediminibacterium paludis]|uniref:Glycosyltransferase n=1 Tax=Parasediminibacterium paludis TaxID=908966 RepID=A0ABV8PYR3_9BACT